jgi:PAS domain S-box-containing protein
MTDQQQNAFNLLTPVPVEPPQTKWYNSLQSRMYLRFAIVLAVTLGLSHWVIVSTGARLSRDMSYRVSEETGNRVVVELAGNFGQCARAARALADTASPVADAEDALRGLSTPDGLAGAAGLYYEAGLAGEHAGKRFLWTRDEGSLWSPADPANTPRAVLGSEWYQTARLLGPGSTYWSAPHADNEAGRLVITCASPVHRDGVHAGVAAVHVYLDTLLDRLNGLTAGTPGYWMVFDRANRVLPGVAGLNPAGADRVSFSALSPASAVAETHPGYAPLAVMLQEINDQMTARVRWVAAEREDLLEELGKTDASEIPNGPALAAATAFDVLADMTASSALLRTGDLRRDLTGSRAHVGVFHVPGAYLKLAHITPRAAAVALTGPFVARQAVAMVLILTVPLVLLLLLMLRDFIGPLRRMSQYIMGITETEGDFLQGLGESAPNEVVELAYAFNRRTDALRNVNVQLRRENIVRERAEMALRESEARFRNVLENTRDLLYKLNIETRLYEYISPAAIEVTGYTQDELVRLGVKGIMERIHPDDRDLVRGHFKEMLAATPTEEPMATQIEYRWTAKNGTVIWASENRTLVRDEYGTPVALVGSSRDVTERRRVEQEVARMRHYLQSVIDSMPSVLIGVDNEGHVTNWNSEAKRVTGKKEQEAFGKPFQEVYPLLDIVAHQVEEAIDKAVQLESERFTSEGPDGETRHYDLIVYPLVAQGVEGAVIRIDEVTARVQIEEMMVQTEKMMSVGGLAAGMAHEINNPLGGILQACQNIERRTSPDLQRNRQTADQIGISIELIHEYMEQRGIVDFIRGIRADGTRAAKIVADMLAFSRRSESHFAPADVRELIDTVLRLAANDYDLKKHYDFRKINIVSDFDPAITEIRCDKTKLEQVLLNLIKNAAQAMATNPGQQDPTLTLRVRLDDEHVRLEIADNGPGMPEKVRRRVFEPFFTTKEVGVGTGLGLSVSYFIITKQHRGTMNVESAPGTGTRFTIRIPLNIEG